MPVFFSFVYVVLIWIACPNAQIYRLEAGESSARSRQNVENFGVKNHQKMKFPEFISDYFWTLLEYPGHQKHDFEEI